MTQQDFEFLTQLKEKWEATKRTGSRNLITAEDVTMANEVHYRMFNSAIRPCSSCFMESIHSMIIQRDLYEASLPQEPTIIIEDEKPASRRKGGKTQP